jgi:hypothetical protein
VAAKLIDGHMMQMEKAVIAIISIEGLCFLGSTTESARFSADFETKRY